MSKLLVAVSSARKKSIEEICDERTAGLWVGCIVIHVLNDEKGKKDSNDQFVGKLADNGEVVFVDDKLTSAKNTKLYGNIQRYNRWEMEKKIKEWLIKQNLDWYSEVESYRKSSPYSSINPSEWREQFLLVDPVYGSRAGAAILAQFRLVTASEFSEWFSSVPDIDFHTYFVGADRHSGDYRLINILANRHDGSHLFEVKELPATIKCKEKICLYSDAGWSGGESKRRLKCLYTKCTNKPNSLRKTNYTTLRFAFLTDYAEKKLREHIKELVQSKIICNEDRVKISYPPENLLKIKGEHEIQKGLAFQNKVLLDYVDSTDSGKLRQLCSVIGKQIAPAQPLGTNEIGSTIAFAHSLPKAMLPVLIMGGEVKAHDGRLFHWKPLLKSKHITNPAPEKSGYHCEGCPLADRLIGRKQLS